MVRVAVLQVPSSGESATGQATCLRLLDLAIGSHGAEILVCPELSCDRRMEAGEGSSGFSRALTQLAQRHGVWIVSALRTGELVTQTVDGPSGEPVRRVFAAAVRGRSLEDEGGPLVVTTPHGTIGVCGGAQLREARGPRPLALAGAELICAPTGDCSSAELALPVGARAVENRVFVTVAARVGSKESLYPAWKETLPPELGSWEDDVRAGVSQIVGPDGRLLQVATAGDGAIVCAELDLQAAAHKQSKDGTSLLALRRPDLYGGYGSRDGRDANRVSADDLPVAALTFASDLTPGERLMDACAQIERLATQGVALVVLPELFCFEPGSLRDQRSPALELTEIARVLADACMGTPTHVVTSLPEQLEDRQFHVGVVIGQRGLVMRQPQLHVPKRHDWAAPGARAVRARMPWGTLAVLVGEDALIPELVELHARAGADLLAAPLSASFCAGAGLSLPALADEHRLGVVAALRTEEAGDDLYPQTSFIVDPSNWPAARALEEQRVLRGTIRLWALREERVRRAASLRAFSV